MTPWPDAPASTALLPEPAGGWSARRLLLAAAALSLLAAAALTIDFSAARLVQQRRWPGDAQRLIALAETFGWGGSVALIILAAATLDPRGWRIVPRLAAGAYGA